MTTHQITVGLDGSTNSWNAFDWAAAEATRTNRTLFLAHAGDVTPCSAGVDPFAYGQELIADAIARTTDDHPHLNLRSAVKPSDPAELLLQLARLSDLVVVGRAERRFAPISFGSVAEAVLAGSSCPAVVVSEPANCSSNTIVAGASTSLNGLAALRAAFTEAERRGGDLVVVRSWSDPNYRWCSSSGLPLADPDTWVDCARAELDTALESVRPSFPGVPVRTVVSGDPIELALEKAACGAALLVLGRRHETGSTRHRLGPVAKYLSRHEQPPVMIAGQPLPIDPSGRVDVRQPSASR